MNHIAVCGGGNVGHALAAVLGSRDDVAVLTRRPEFWTGPVTASCGGFAAVGTRVRATADAATAVTAARLVIVTVPAHRHEATLNQIAPFVSTDAWVGAMPAHGQFHERAAIALRRRSRIFGAEGSPYNCRVTTVGREVTVSGVVPRLGVATLDRGEAAGIAALLEQLLGIPTDILPDPMAISLRPLNIALHPSRLYALLKQWDGRSLFARAPSFYREWDLAASRVYLACSDELENLALALGLDPDAIDAVARRYGTADPERLTNRLRELGRHGLPAMAVPMRRDGDFYRPDFESRLFQEDIDVGLAVVQRLARQAGIALPVIDAIVAWADRIRGI